MTPQLDRDIGPVLAQRPPCATWVRRSAVRREDARQGSVVGKSRLFDRKIAKLFAYAMIPSLVRFTTNRRSGTTMNPNRSHLLPSYEHVRPCPPTRCRSAEREAWWAYRLVTRICMPTPPLTLLAAGDAWRTIP